MEILEALENLMIAYEIISGIGGVLQIVLLIMRRKGLLLIFGLLLDVVSLSGMSCGHIITGEPLLAIVDITTVILDVAFIVYILYREKHPKEKNNRS